MKKSVLFLTFVIFSAFSILNQTQNINNYIANESNNISKLHCSSPPSFEESIKNETKKDDKETDQNWYSKVMENIQNEEYNISYSDELGEYQSPNRVNNIRFIYHNNGFTAKTRDNKIPLFNVNDKTIREEDKKYETIPEWSIDFKMQDVRRETRDVNNVQCSMFNPQFKTSEIKVDNNKAYIEDDNMRIEYTNNKDGMRQDFIIKNKPGGEGKLRLNLSADTKLRMLVKADALMFKDRNGNEKMKYSALKVWDANGKELRTYFETSSLKNEKLKLKNKKLSFKIKNEELSSVVPNPIFQIPNNINQKSKIQNLKSFSIVVNDEHAEYPITIDPLSTSPDWTAESNQDVAYFGYSVSTAGDVNGDGYSDVIVGAPQYDNGQTDEGSAFAYYGSATGLSLTPNWIAESNEANAFFGTSVSTAGDVNGDGYSDVIVGAPSYIGPFHMGGKAYVYYGSAAGLSNTANWTAYPLYLQFGIQVSTAGDVNGDGYSDVIVGSHYRDINLQVWGRASVYYGSATGLSNTANWIVQGNQSGGGFSHSVSTAGDVNGDGYSDVIVGAYYYEGKVFAYYGSATGLSTTANWIVVSNQIFDSFGYSVSTAGDVNDDGYSDVIVGAHFSDEGKAFVYYGSASGLSTTANWTAEGNQAVAEFGRSVSTAGDVNNDGYSDVIVGSTPYYDNSETNEGRAFVYYGSATGLSTTTNWTAENNQGVFGYSLSTAGDVNSDGYSDVIVGDYLYNNGQGKAFAYYGGPVKVLNLTVFIQGFYRASLNSTIQDTVKVYLRSVSIPYPITDSANTYLDTLGTGVFAFSNALDSVNYYIVVKHRNSIETWSTAGISFTNNYSTYNFSTSLTQAYGSNMIQSDNSPLRFAIYSGDVNQDGIVDLTDVSLVDNDSYNFVSGYVSTDLNGDETVDIADVTIADNNSYNFVSKISP